MIATEFIDLKEAQDIASGSGSNTVWQSTGNKHVTMPSNATNLILHFHIANNVTFEFVTSHDGIEWQPISQQHDNTSDTLVRLSNDSGHILQYIGWRLISGDVDDLTHVKLFFGRSK